MSDRSCDYKWRTGTRTAWRWKRREMCQTAVATTKGGQGHVLSGGEKARQHVRSQLRLQNEGQGRRTPWSWRGRATCQIAVATTRRRQGPTYPLEIEKEGDMSERSCDYKRGQGRRTAWRWRG
jgi:hypothetical protein